MSRLLHDPMVRDAIRSRISALNAGSPRAWGKMTPDQMLWHCNTTLEAAMGRHPHPPMKVPMPKFLLKFVVLNLPWPKGSPTHPEWVAGDRYDFDAEQARCLTLIDEFTRTPLESSIWAPSPGFGAMSGRDQSRLAANHLDHHLRQFSV